MISSLPKLKNNVGPQRHSDVRYQDHNRPSLSGYTGAVDQSLSLSNLRMPPPAHASKAFRRARATAGK